MIHEIPLERATLHGHFSRDLPPIVEVDPGDSIAFSCPNAGWRLNDGKVFEPRDETLDQGHALIGPIAVRGAEEGKTLVVQIDEVRPGTFGETFGRGTRIEWALDAAGGIGTDDRGASVELAPFLGVIGMPPSEDGVHSTGPPRRCGGNIDCKELVAGTTLYIPISVDGAHVSAGDGHAAQGDGELSGTAIECYVERAQLTFELSELELRSPIARVGDTWLAFGFDEDLDLAAEEAIGTMLDVMEREHGFDRSYAIALGSVAVDLRVTQIVNGVKGVHAVLRDGAFDA
ncbi:MAG TPA: acetamidase/formamidase family protein [Gaiellaceae bacterium]|nr:acetamidase/formamidase family protein [Gaiellaceae bacterium]HWJ44663.1 acetamidase/formamidase family protein [Gaiellaceae bacterium]